MDAVAVRRGCPAAVAWRTALLAATLGALSSGARGTERGPEFVGRVDPFLKAAVTRAFFLALERLSQGRCMRIFSEFSDAAGRPLAANLEAAHRTASGQLTSIRFADGAHEKPCADLGVLAFTHPLTTTIYVCGQRFAILARTNPALAATLILHEELHSLGLGENPPESREITTSVMRRCGR